MEKTTIPPLGQVNTGVPEKIDLNSHTSDNAVKPQVILPKEYTLTLNMGDDPGVRIPVSDNALTDLTRYMASGLNLPHSCIASSKKTD